MDRVTVYLRTSLFSVGAPEAHVPVGVMVVEGTVSDQAGGGLTITTARLLDDRGRELSDSSLELKLPWSKVDHVVVHKD